MDQRRKDAAKERRALKSQLKSTEKALEKDIATHGSILQDIRAITWKKNAAISGANSSFSLTEDDTRALATLTKQRQEIIRSTIRAREKMSETKRSIKDLDNVLQANGDSVAIFKRSTSIASSNDAKADPSGVWASTKNQVSDITACKPQHARTANGRRVRRKSTGCCTHSPVHRRIAC